VERPVAIRAVIRTARTAAVAASAIAASAAFAAGAEAYVTNERGGIDVIDLDTLAVTRTLATGGEGPRGLALTPDARYILAANKGSGEVCAIDRATGAIAHRVKVGLNPEMVRINGRFAYVTYEPVPSEEALKHEAAKGEGAAMPKPGTGASRAAEPEKDDDAAKAEIAIVDLDHWKVVKSIPSGHETEGVEFSADGRLMAVTNEGDDTISVYDRVTGKEIKSVSTAAYGKRPRGIKAIPGGKGYVVTLEFSDKFLVLDRDFKILREVATKSSPYGVAFSPDGSRLLVAAAKSGVLQEFDAATFAATRDMAVGKRCWHFTYSPDASKILAACGRSDAVYVVDAQGGNTLKVIEGEKGPWGIVTYPRANGSLDVR